MKNSVVMGMVNGYNQKNKKVDIILTPVFPASTKAGFSFERFFCVGFRRLHRFEGRRCLRFHATNEKRAVLCHRVVALGERRPGTKLPRFINGWHVQYEP